MFAVGRLLQVLLTEPDSKPYQFIFSLYLVRMKVVRTTPEKITEQRQKHFESLKPEERLAILRMWMQRLEKPGFDYSFKGLKVQVKKSNELI